MQKEEYGEKGRPEAVILHGGGLAPWSQYKAAGYLGKDFHITLPVLDGHAGSDRPYTSIRSNAEEIIRHIDDALGGHIKLLTGLSLGAQTALEILALRPGIADSAVIESAAIIPTRTPKWLLKDSITISALLAKRRSFAAMQFRKLKLPASMFDDYFRDTALIKTDDMVKFLTESVKYRVNPDIVETRAKMHILYGGKEPSAIRKSALKLKELLPDAELTEIEGLRHGEASMKLHYSYVSAIRSVTK